MTTYPAPLSAQDKESFAYATISRRLPEILAKVVDSCHRQIAMLKEKYGQKGADDGVEVVGKISRLRSCVMTDKPLEKFDDQFANVDYWNKTMEEQRQLLGDTPSWFKAPWLYVECYMYRYIHHCLVTSKYMKDFDPFMLMKEKALEAANDSMKNLANYFLTNCKSISSDQSQVKELFMNFLQISLWANRSDLSLSCGSDNCESVRSDPRANIEKFKKFILADDSEAIWNHLIKLKQDPEVTDVRVDIVLDNYGMEFFSDLILADFLITSNLATSVLFHPKSMPWFVSDVTASRDVTAMIEAAAGDQDADVAECGRRWRSLFDTDVFRVSQCDFWTTAAPFCEMSQTAPGCHDTLSRSSLVVFKGDLNYRKLVGDLAWPHVTPFRVALRGFEPAPLCTLRTLKADVVVGVEEGQGDERDKDWMVSGRYAVVQAHIK